MDKGNILWACVLEAANFLGNHVHLGETWVWVATINVVYNLVVEWICWIGVLRDIPDSIVFPKGFVDLA